MSDFKAKMHQIRFRLWLRPRPRWGVYSAPRPSSWIRGREGEGKGIGKGRGEGWGGSEGQKQEGRGGNKRKGWRREWEKVKEGMGGTGQDTGDGGIKKTSIPGAATVHQDRLSS